MKNHLKPSQDAMIVVVVHTLPGDRSDLSTAPQRPATILQLTAIHIHARNITTNRRDIMSESHLLEEVLQVFDRLASNRSIKLISEVRCIFPGFGDSGNGPQPLDRKKREHSHIA